MPVNTIPQSELDEIAPVIDWERFYGYVFNWEQGEHVGLIGPTGTGKSTLTRAILPIRSYVVYFATKIRDETLDELAKSEGYTKIKDWPPTKGRGPAKRAISAEEMPKRILWPDANSLYARKHQKDVFERAIADIYIQGRWAVVWDEFWFMCTLLGLETEARVLLQQARSNDISFVMGAQRPSRVPLELFDQSTHLFFSRDNDERNLKAISGVGWLAAGPIKELVAALEPHQFLYINTRHGFMYRTTCPA